VGYYDTIRQVRLKRITVNFTALTVPDYNPAEHGSQQHPVYMLGGSMAQ
jgi:hypothetical protein